MCQPVAEFAHGAISARGVCATPCRAGRRCRRHRRVGGLARIVRGRAPWLLDTAANGTAPNGPSHLTPPHIRYSHSMLTFLGIWVFMMVVMGITLRGIISKSLHRFHVHRHACPQNAASLAEAEAEIAVVETAVVAAEGRRVSRTPASCAAGLSGARGSGTDHVLLVTSPRLNGGWLGSDFRRDLEAGWGVGHADG